MPSGTRASGCARSSRSCSVIALAGRPTASRGADAARSRGRPTGCGLYGSQPGRDSSGRPGGARKQAPRQMRSTTGASAEVVVDIDAKTCPCCKGDLHQIGEDKSERLDMVPAQFRVITRRPKYACRACEDGVLQAEAPARLIEGGQPTEATAAQVWFPNMPIICRSTGRPRSMPARASLSIGRRWRTGLGMLPSTCARCTSTFLRRFGPGPNCLPTRRRCRCSIPVEGAPRPASSGPMPPTTGLGPASIRPHRLCYAPDRARFAAS